MSRTNGHHPDRVDAVLLLGTGSRAVRIELRGADLDVEVGGTFQSSVGPVRLTNIRRSRIEDLGFEIAGGNANGVLRKAIVYYGDYEPV